MGSRTLHFELANTGEIVFGSAKKCEQLVRHGRSRRLDFELANTGDIIFLAEKCEKLLRHGRSKRLDFKLANTGGDYFRPCGGMRKTGPPWGFEKTGF